MAWTHDHLGGHESAHMGIANEIGAAMQLQLLGDAGAIGFHAFDTYMDLRSDLSARIPLSQLDEHLALTWAQEVPGLAGVGSGKERL
jgi:hypothetical protein